MSWTLFAISIFLYVSLDFAGHLLLGATQLAVSNVLENLFEKILVTHSFSNSPLAQFNYVGLVLSSISC